MDPFQSTPICIDQDIFTRSRYIKNVGLIVPDAPSKRQLYYPDSIIVAPRRKLRQRETFGCKRMEFAAV